MHLDEALLLAVDDRAIDLAERPHERVDGDPLGGGVVLVEPHVRDLGVGVRAPRDRQRREALAAEEEGILNHDARGEIRDVRELGLQTDVAGGEDARVRRPQLIVDDDAPLAVELDADRLETEIVDVRGAPGADQDLVDGDLVLAPAHPEVQALAFVYPLDTLDLGAELEAQAFAPQHGLDEGGGVLVLAAEDLRQDVEGDDLRSQAAKGLRELAADRPGADDGEAAWLLRQREHGLVRQVAGRLETFDRRRGGARAGGDHRFGEA